MVGVGVERAGLWLGGLGLCGALLGPEGSGRVPPGWLLRVWGLVGGWVLVVLVLLWLVCACVVWVGGGWGCCLRSG
jgi:hypothetical protein